MTDLPGVLAELAEIIGQDEAKKIGRIYAGCRIVIPSLRSQSIAERDAKILEQYNGNNVMLLANKYDLSRQAIYDIINKRRANERP